MVHLKFLSCEIKLAMNQKYIFKWRRITEGERTGRDCEVDVEKKSKAWQDMMTPSVTVSESADTLVSKR